MRALALLLLLTTPAVAAPLSGKSFIIQLSSAQYSSGYGEYLVPPLYSTLRASGLIAKRGPGADVAVNVVTDSDVGKWVRQGGQKVWLYTVSAMVGISPEAYEIPETGTPAFGVTASLVTPNPDRQDEMECLIKLATLTALRDYQPKGKEAVDGQSCLRK